MCLRNLFPKILTRGTPRTDSTNIERKSRMRSDPGNLNN